MKEVRNKHKNKTNKNETNETNEANEGGEVGICSYIDDASLMGVIIVENLLPFHLSSQSLME